jgi:hypothetical protein
MFETISQVETYYLENTHNKHEIIYKTFDKNVSTFNPELSKAFNNAEGFGEHAFCWNWQLLIGAMSSSFKFLEIGVYKGRTLGVIQLLANMLKKKCEIYGITPLTNVGDKYSKYDDVNYSYSLFMNINKMGVDIDNINIIKGLSTDFVCMNEANATGPYDILFIDGCHDYDVVCKDITTYLPMLKSGGYLVMDDASLFLENPYGQFLGHKDVCQAIKDTIDSKLNNLTHIFAVGHNRVWRKM